MGEANLQSGRLLFSTDSLAERDRFPAFCEEMMRRYAALDIVARGDKTRFRASIDLQQAGTVGIGYVSTTPSEYARTPQLVRDGDDALCFVLCLRGGAYQTQGDQDRTLRAGEGIICDSGNVGGIFVTHDSEFWSLKVPRPRITRLLPPGTRYPGTKLDKDPIATRLLFSYLESSRAIDMSGGGRATAVYDDHIVDLIALALGSEGDAYAVAERRGGRAARIGAILRDIERLLCDPGLSAATIAIRQGVTPRYVRMLLEDTGRSFSEHVLEKRLQHASALLRRDNPAPRLRIADIAFACGFSDLSYFNRVFRRRYGATPSDMRAQAGQTDC